MNTRRAVCAAALIAATVTACNGSGEPKTIRVTVTQTVTSSPGTSATANADSGVLEMGAKKTIDDDANDVHITVQAIEYQQPYKGPQPHKPEDFQGGDIWAAASIKVCNVSGPNINVSQIPWSLAYNDGTSIDSTGLSGGDMPKPEFPMDKPVKSGRCGCGADRLPGAEWQEARADRVCA
ncbi:DUF4352 domain-containing protein [Streptomyces flaveolus]|uniref:DUF4352 domain-containing protein n=1 Tax=Streptomyces flaveolus TaxID=67297 RepID=UPI0033FF3D10